MAGFTRVHHFFIQQFTIPRIAGIAVCFFLIALSHRIDALTNAQFWAEDGRFWFAEAYHNGFLSLFTPHTGYFQTISRLSALMAQFVPLAYAPAVMNIIALGIKIIPALYIITRFSTLFRREYAWLFAIIYLALANSQEVFGNITNAHWHLAILACMILIADNPKTRMAKICDRIFLVLSGLSGPFALFLFPLALVAWKKIRNIKGDTVVILGICACLQLAAIVFTAPEARIDMELGVAPVTFSRIVFGQVVLGSLVGTHLLAYAYTHYFGIFPLATTLFFITGTALVGLFEGFVFWRAPWQIRTIQLFALSVFVASIITPMASLSLPQWQVMAEPGAAGRYWFIPMFAFLASVLWYISTLKQKKRHVAAVFLAIVLCIGALRDWMYPPFSDLGFQERAALFDQLRPGEEMRFFIQPDGKWDMRLIKK